jgi:DNA-binding NarL/FixJ family response regulator
VPIRVVVADDHPIVLQGLQQLFARQGDIEVVACCTDATEAREAVLSQQPDVLVLDLRMPGQTGLDLLRTLAEDRTSCRSVLLTASIREDEVVDAVKLGAMGIVLKESPPETLVECVRRVHNGDSWIDRQTAARAFQTVVDRQAATDQLTEVLTPREIEIIKMVAQGLRNRVLAERLSISEGTVKVHLHNIYEKLGVDGRLELVLFAQQKGLL